MSDRTGMTGTEGSSAGRYEVELREPLPGAEGWAWKPVTVFVADAIPTPLRFDTFGAAQAYVARLYPGAARIVLVDDEGGRQVVG